MKVTLHTDGGTWKKNPGKAAYGWVIFARQDGREINHGYGTIGVATNNIAEYIGVITGMLTCLELGYTDVLVRCDSKLVVDQINRKYGSHAPRITPLMNEARNIANRFERFKIEWVPRKKNARADALARLAMDERYRK